MNETRPHQPALHAVPEPSVRETLSCPVSSYTEWDPLEEVVVGVMDGATVPSWHVTLQATMPRKHWEFFRRNGGKAFPADQVTAANANLDQLARVLEACGVVVRRPERLDHGRAFSTPEWKSRGGLYAAMPRDLLLVLGDEILETPMAWRSRYYEAAAYRPLLKEYFDRGARWTAAPRPQLSDPLYVDRYGEPGPHEPMRYAVTEFEPVFDAADFLRCGRDVLYIRSHVTNRFGVRWLERHVGDRFRFHELTTRDRHPMHIDTTFLPLAPGKLLVNPDRFAGLPPMFDSWDVLEAPPPCTPPGHTLYMSGPWLSMNVLSVDESTVVVADHEVSLIRSLERWGFHAIPCPFLDFYTFGGSIHCATLDVRRRGGLESYF